MKLNVADYLVLSDTQLRLSSRKETGHPRDKNCPFVIPPDLATGALVNPVLVFRTIVLEDHGTRIRVFVNPVLNQQSSDGFPSEDDYHIDLPKNYLGLHMEALPVGKFKKGQENSIVITISGDGTKFGDVIIGDVVLMFQRDITI